MNSGQDRRTSTPARARVLFVDDEPRALDALRRSARLHAWEARFVDSASQALGLLENWPADAVVADLKMPNDDGLALLAGVRSMRPATARFILSGCVEREPVLSGLQVAHQSFPKPCNLGDIAGRVDRCRRLRERLGAPGLSALGGRETGLPLEAAQSTALGDALRAGDVAPATLMHIVGEAPGLAAALLRLAGSPALVPGGAAAELAGAIRHLGNNTLRDWLAQEPAVHAAADTGLVTRRLDAEQARSRRIARAARIIASLLGLRPAAVEASYLAGLLHNMGRMLLLARAPCAYLDVLDECATRGVAINEAECTVFGTDYASFGGYLAALWGLPATIGDAVAGHVSPQTAAGGAHAVTAPVHLAVALSGSDGWETPAPDRAVLEAFGLVGRLDALRAAIETPVDPEAAAC